MFLETLQKNAFENLDITGYTADIKGWKYDSFDSIFEHIIEKCSNDPTIIEVGSWKGLSATTMAKIAKSKNKTPKIICVDTWIGSREFWLKDATEDMNLSLVNGYPSIFYIFTKNVKASGHSDVIYPLPACSTVASEILRHYDIQADIIYIDASHDYNSVYQDLKYFWNTLKNGGYMFGDDFSPGAWPGVVKAVEQFSLEMNVRLNVLGGVWFFNKA